MGKFYLRTEKYLDQLTPDGAWIEIGTSRNGDDGSTKIIAEWASRYDSHLWTVDIDPLNCEFAESLTIPNVEISNTSGELFLQEFPSPISFLYLDNFDWDWHPEKTEDFVLSQQQRYSELGCEMNNVNSQRAHLAQMCSAIQKMTPNSIVVCDDTWYNKWWGHYSGKCGAVVPFLLNHGFTVLDTMEEPEYGTILGRNIT
jgi:hypothetical protein